MSLVNIEPMVIKIIDRNQINMNDQMTIPAQVWLQALISSKCDPIAATAALNEFYSNFPGFRPVEPNTGCDEILPPTPEKPKWEVDLDLLLKQRDCLLSAHEYFPYDQQKYVKEKFNDIVNLLDTIGDKGLDGVGIKGKFYTKVDIDKIKLEVKKSFISRNKQDLVEKLFNEILDKY